MAKCYLYNMLNALAICFLIIVLPSCMHYYKATNTSIEKIEQHNTSSTPISNKYLILRSGNNAFHMDNPILDKTGKSITCLIDSLPDDHGLHLKKGMHGKMRYKKHGPYAGVIDEIHFYTVDDNTIVTGKNYTLTAEKITKIELLEKDKSRTTTSFILGGIGYTLCVFIIVAVIAVATSSWK